MVPDSAAESPPETAEAAGGPAVGVPAADGDGGAAGAPDGGAPMGSVQIAYCHEHSVSHSFHTSLLSTYAYDKAMGSNSIGGAPIQVYCSGPHGLVEGRNEAVRMFLDEGDHEWLFWIDTDMGWDPRSLDALLLAADPIERPVMGGLCFAYKMAGSDDMGGYRMIALPTLFGLAKDVNQRIGYVNRRTYPPNTLYQTAGTGSAFILIHRSVLERIRTKHGDEWYSPISYDNGKAISEDLSFCWRVADVGLPIFVHTGVKVTHHKELWVSEDDYNMPDEDPIFKPKTEMRVGR